jgi:hypothetical protein
MKLTNKFFLASACLVGFSGLNYGMEEQIIEKKEFPVSLDSSKSYRLDDRLFWNPSQIRFYFDDHCKNMVNIVKEKNFSIYKGFAQVACFLRETDAVTWIGKGKEHVRNHIVELCKNITERDVYIELEKDCIRKMKEDLSFAQRSEMLKHLTLARQFVIYPWLTQKLPLDLMISLNDVQAPIIYMLQKSRNINLMKYIDEIAATFFVEALARHQIAEEAPLQSVLTSEPEDYLE